MSMRVDGYDSFDHLKIGLEASELELKKQSNQAKRLGNSELKNHPQLEKLQGAFKTLQPEQLLKILKNTGNAISGQGGTVNLTKEELPQLLSPQSMFSEAAPEMASRSAEPKLSNAAQMTALLGRITQLSSESTLESLQGKLQSFNAMMSGAVSSFTAMAKQLEQQGIALAEAKDALQEAQKQADTLLKESNTAQSKLTDAKNKLSDLEAEAAKDPDSKELKEKVALAKQDVTTAQANATNAKNAYDNHVENTLNPATQAVTDAETALKNSQTVTVVMISSVSKQQQVVIETKRKETDAEAKSLTFLMALMSQLINESSNEDLKATAELKAKLAEASAKDAQKKAEEYEQQVREAEEMQKTMGCIGKVLGWLITAVSFVAAAFTGGASLALAAVGLALAIGDEISQAVSGRSFMADAMQPLMDAIVKPLMELFGKMFSEILQAFGVDKESADMAGQIMGAIAAAAVLVAAVFVAGSVMSKVAGVVMQKLGADVAAETSKTVAKEASKAVGKSIATEVEKQVASNVAKTVATEIAKDVAEEVAEEVAKKTLQSIIRKLLDSTIGQALKKMSQGIGRNIGMSETKMAQVSTRSQMAVAGGQMLNTTIQVTGSIVAADMMVEASKARAKMMQDAALQSLLNEMMDRAVDTFTHRMETMNAIIQNISVIAENQMQAGKYITRQMASVAG
ncbi:type III secretion system translocon subunit SctE [Vagococcus sp. WN89Y]|uniref:type III secretion system translocon subunit SctE n=1 Tax=Vagococcus sp. WN89Y TaxID=3457258 RepID=UPI003FCE7283